MKNKIQHIISAMALTLGFSYTANAQVTAQKIGTNPTTIAPSAVLDIESANKGVLFPRVALTSTTDVTTIASPATALTIYNTATAGTAPNNVTPGYYYWNGTKWTKVATEAEASKWSYEAINARIKLNKLSNGTTDRTGATNFSITDDNVLQIGDMTNVPSPALPERGIVVRKTGNASITSVSDGGTYSVFENQIYGDNVPGSAAYNVFAKSRGSLASPQAVQNGDLIGIFDYRGFSGTGYGNSARIMTRVEGPVTTTSVPVSFEFHTVGPGETSPSQRLKISSNGNVGIGASSPANKLEITQGTAGNSGLRFTNLNSTSTATTSASKVLGLNSTGDVILTNVPGTQNIVSFSTATPTTSGVVFTPNTPIDQSVVYQSATDNSLWTYNGTTYVTYSAPASTAWNLANTTNDAGSNKTSGIWRSGSVGIGTNNPSTTLHIQSPLPGTATVNTDAQVLRLSRLGTPSVKWDNIAQFNLGSFSSNVAADSKLDLVLNNTDLTLSSTPVMTWHANGNVGIGTSTPSAPLVAQGVFGNGVLKLIAPSGTGGFTWWMGFGHGTASTDANDRARVGVDIAGGGAGRLFLTTGAPGAQTRAMFVDENQRVGIGTSTPTSRLEVNGAATNTTAFNAGAGTTIDFSRSNLAYTTASPGNTFTLSNLKDGGTYTLAVQGKTAGQASFTITGFTASNIKSPNNGLTAEGKETLYTFMVMGTFVYFYMTTGL